VTLGADAAMSGLAVQCTRCGEWVRLGPAPGAASPSSRAAAAAQGAPPAWGPGAGGGAVTVGMLGGALEVLGLAAAAAGGLMLLALGFAARSFEGMAKELGGDLPGLSAFVFKAHLPWVLAALVLVLAAGALVVRLRGGTAGRWMVGAALALVLVGAPVCIISFYLPVFSLAGSIK